MALSMTSEEYSRLKLEGFFEKNKHSRNLQTKYLPHYESNV